MSATVSCMAGITQTLVAMAASAATAAVVGVEMHRVGKILNRSKLFYRDVTRFSDQYGRDAINNVSASVLNRSWLFYTKDYIRLANNLPVAHIAIFWFINLADALRFNYRSLEGLSCNNSAHSDAVACWNGLSKGFGIYIVIGNIRNTLLGL